MRREGGRRDAGTTVVVVVVVLARRGDVDQRRELLKSIRLCHLLLYCALRSMIVLRTRDLFVSKFRLAAQRTDAKSCFIKISTLW